jgi:hypothetical protein
MRSDEKPWASKGSGFSIEVISKDANPGLRE